MTTVTWGAATDVGKARERNEDSFYAGDHVFVVADGLGGHRAGEVASAILVDGLAQLDGNGGHGEISAALETAILDANRAIMEHAERDPETAGMGTTVTALAIEGPIAHLAHVGDSRCYLFRGGEFRLVSQDHTLVARMVDEGTITVEQAESHPQRSILTRALGADAAITVDSDTIALQDADRLLLCSDGLSSVVPEPRIAEILATDNDAQATCSQLVDEANRLGGPDNITVVLLDISGVDSAPAAAPTLREPVLREPVHRESLPVRQRRRLPRRAIAWLVVVAVVIAGGIAGLKAWANRSWYVGVDNGAVVIFRGLPTDFVVSLSSVKERSATKLDEVAPYYRDRLVEGIRANTLEEARGIVARVPRGLDTSPSPSPSPSPGPPTPSPTVTAT